MRTKSNLLDNTNNFDFTILRTENEITYEYHQSGASKNIMEIINKQKKSRNSSVAGGTTKIYKTQRPAFKIRQQFEPKTASIGKTGQAGKNDVASIDLRLLFKNIEKNQWG